MSAEGAAIRTGPAQALRLRQQALVARSSVLRQRLRAESQVLQPPLVLADRLRAGWHWLLAHPEVGVTAVLVVVVLRPRRAWRLGLRLWWGWRTLRRVQDTLGVPPPR